MVRSLVVLQTLVAALYTPTIWNQFRSGEMSAPVFMAFVSASVLLVAGAFLLSTRPRSSSYVFFSSALPGAIACMQWRPPFVLAGLLIAVCAGLVGSVSKAIRKGLTLHSSRIRFADRLNSGIKHPCQILASGYWSRL